MIRLNQRPQRRDVAPQAIFWRPISYFSPYFEEAEDSLDRFETVTFDYGNQFSYDVRHYRADPAYTSTLFLPLDMDGQGTVVEAIEDIVKAAAVPQYAVAWRRGEPFAYGHLDRKARDRFREDEARNLVLKISARSANHTATISEIRRQVPAYFDLSEADLKASQTRAGEQMWQQIIRNVVSHQEGTRSIFRRGLAIRNGERITTTAKGLDYLNSLGFSAPEP